MPAPNGGAGDEVIDVVKDDERLQIMVPGMDYFILVLCYIRDPILSHYC